MHETETLNKYFRNTDQKLSLSMEFPHVSVCVYYYTLDSTILIYLLTVSGFTCSKTYIKTAVESEIECNKWCEKKQKNAREYNRKRAR